MPTSITRDDLRSALHSLTVVDALAPTLDGQRRLPGAISVVEDESDEHIARVLPDKAAAIVPGRAVELHTHPYAETFLLLEGRGRWTGGDEVLEPAPEDMLVVAPGTPHGFRNIGDVALLVVSVHERGTLRQTWLGESRRERRAVSRRSTAARPPRPSRVRAD